MKISIVGVGKLGSVLGKLLSNHYDVCGYDVADVDVDFDMSSTLKECVDDSQYIFVVGPTPHLEKYEGSVPCSFETSEDFDYTILKTIFSDLEKVINPRQTIVLVSTVSPGTIRSVLRPLLPNKIIYSPLLIAQGTIEQDMQNPEMLIIGTEDNNTSESYDFASMYSCILAPGHGDIYHASGTWEDCECIKMMYNTFLSMKILFANTILDIADNMDHMSVDTVTTALSSCNKRLFSGKHFTAGMGPGGVCLPRDNVVMGYVLDKISAGYNLFEGMTYVREKQAKAMADRLLAYDLPVVIIGKSYKPEVPIDQGSPSLLVAHYVEKHRPCYFFDPLMKLTPPTFDKAVYLLAHRYVWDHTYGFKFPKGSIILDPWRMCPDIPGCTVVRIGDYVE